MAKKSKEKVILIVEDNATTLRIYANRFTAAGFTVVETTTANDIENLSQAHKPDAYIVDLMLQDGDGFQIIKNIRSSKNGAKKPIIVLSNLSQQKDIDEATQAGADRYFIKSDTNLSEVVEALNSLL